MCRINSSEMTFTFTNGSQIMCIGLDIPEKIKSIEGITGIWAEEATELTEKDISQLDLRLRAHTRSYHQMMFSFNPEGKNNQIYKLFYENGTPRDTTLHHSTYLDNRFLDKRYHQVLIDLKEKDYNSWLIYAKGEWGQIEHIIFKNWDIVDEIPTKYTKSDAIYGADFGFVHNTAVVKIVKDKDDIYIEEMLYRDGMTNLDLINWIKKHIPDSNTIYYDAAEPARGEEARRFDIDMVAATKGPNSVKDSIDFIKRHRLHITRDSVGIIDEISSYKWRQDRQGNVLEKPVDYNDDLIAAIRYGVYSHYGKSIEVGACF